MKLLIIEAPVVLKPDKLKDIEKDILRQINENGFLVIDKKLQFRIEEIDGIKSDRGDTVPVIRKINNPLYRKE